MRGTAGQARIDETRLAVAYDLIDAWVCDDSVGGAVVAIARDGIFLEPRAFGQRNWRGQQRPMAPEDVFLVASVTKPFTAAMLMLEISRGRASLSDRVVDHIPEFGDDDRENRGDGRENIRLIHLLTHTSGLPDMLETNEQLRADHAPLSAFVEGTCHAPLLFPPGDRVSYQSKGTLLAGEIASRLSGVSLPDMLKTEIFDPCHMSSSVLGYDACLDDRVVAVELDDGIEDQTDWHWNSDYWRHLGAPWGGMHASADDLLGWLQLFLTPRDDTAVFTLGPSVCNAMILDQTQSVIGLNPEDRRHRRWGLGWRIGGWGDLASSSAFSHGGATGTLVGADPETGLACVLLTTRPGAPLGRLLTAIQGALLP
ncbi:MAG: beta-lactamase family protein [Gemmatimonadetes bacterium]|nr:beta-lactamase family protein [Gemmatimonadota bacterium]MBT6149592.1 beta-lactamase family protein [Gemmatimonadota bacterium]MBT7861441.1 beta-lactamase family protein [Gemmatimonadota bacterium]